MPRSGDRFGLYGPPLKKGTKRPTLDVNNPTPPSAPIRVPEGPPPQPPKPQPLESKAHPYWEKAWTPKMEALWTRTERKRHKATGQKILATKRARKEAAEQEAEQEAEQARQQARHLEEEPLTPEEEQQRTAEIRQRGYASRVVPAEPLETPTPRDEHFYWRRTRTGQQKAVPYTAPVVQPSPRKPGGKRGQALDESSE